MLDTDFRAREDPALDLSNIIEKLSADDQHFLARYLAADEKEHRLADQHKAKRLAHKASSLVGVSKRCRVCSVTRPASDFGWTLFVDPGICMACETSSQRDARVQYDRWLRAVDNNEWKACTKCGCQVPAFDVLAKNPQCPKCRGERSHRPSGDHGTAASARRGCKCDACIEARRAYMNTRNARLAAKQGRRRRRSPRPELSFGTNSKYVQGCRCGECSRAHREYQREYVARRKTNAAQAA